MSEEFVQTISKAFKEPELSDVLTLMQAVKYCNFRQSQRPDQEAVRKCSMLTEDMAAELSFPCHKSINHLAPRIGMGLADSTPAEVYGFQLAKRLNINPVAVDRLEMELGSARSSDMRVRFFRTHWTNWAHDERFFWVSEQEEEPGVGQLDEILHGLGLYHWGLVEPEDAVIMVKLTAAERRKPTWIDAELTFYFDVCASETKHGYTRCLRSGDSKYREWIARKKHLVPIDVGLLRLADAVDFARPTPEYWDALRMTVEKERASGTA